MTAPVMDREQPPAARAVHAALEAIQLANEVSAHPMSCGRGARIADLLAEIAQDVAWLHSDREAKAAELLEQRSEMCDFARTITELEAAAIAMEQLDTRRVEVISGLKTRLARAAAEIEALYKTTGHEVGDATERHLIVMRARDLLDLDNPLPPPMSAAPNTHTSTSVPRVAAGAR